MALSKSLDEIVNDIFCWSKPVETKNISQETLKNFMDNNAKILNACQLGLIRKCMEPKEEVLKNVDSLADCTLSAFNEQYNDLLPALINIETNKGKYAHVNFCKIYDLKNVSFRPHEYVEADNKKTYSKYPGMEIILTKSYGMLESVCIDTGYIIEIAQTRFGDEYVVIPIIDSTDKNIIPSIICKDRNDSGLFTVNFTTLFHVKEGTKITIHFIALEALQPSVCIDLPFKKKNCQLHRCVANAKDRVDFKSFQKNSDNIIAFKYNDSGCIKSANIVVGKNQHVLLSSRRREWKNPDVFTVAGFFSEKHYLPPMTNVKDASNSFCFTSFGRRVRVIAKETSDFSKCKILNGSFQYMQNYEKDKRAIERMVENVSKFETGIRTILDENDTENLALKFILLDSYRFYNKDLFESKKNMNITDIYNTRNTKREFLNVELHNSLINLLDCDDVVKKRKSDDEFDNECDSDADNGNDQKRNLQCDDNVPEVKKCKMEIEKTKIDNDNDEKNEN
ncbi:unknown [Gryllus bimaculatus nudivirus]|uniref:Uncharacterized protein n=1 Tax=Gryllus bimaculatus nudivirus TaxID=432587 RepID=A4L1Y5_9VIRU|nr:hypothetical protein GrBNV_gp22 [Gryllus bimaculatus nudivirus]ABO45355.1 unknown [Gryllus bimaculatus nudivirus]